MYTNLLAIVHHFVGMGTSEAVFAALSRFSAVTSDEIMAIIVIVIMIGSGLDKSLNFEPVKACLQFCVHL